MKTKLSFLFLFLFCITFQSCKKILYTIHDVRQVEPQSNEALLKFCSSKKIDAGNLRRVKPEMVDSSLKIHLNKHYLFDAQGRFVDYASSFENPRCKGNLLELLKNPSAIEHYPRNASLSLESILNQTIEVVQNKKIESLTENSVEKYTIVMFWNTFSGNPNHKKSYADLHNAIQKCPTGMFSLQLIDQDFHPGTVPTIQWK
jgi:hypothetical protein